VARRIAFRLALICALVLAAVAVLALATPPNPRVATACPGPSYTFANIPPDGSPAIRPRDDCTPSFTEQDARNYVRPEIIRTNLPHVTVAGEPRIASIRFMTLRDLSNLQGDPYLLSSYPADMVVCDVMLRGTFAFQGNVLLPLTTVNAAYLIFDAHSGNFLAAGVFQRR
jgi:hypothetical protein